MIRIGVIGLGFMGKTHLEQYNRLEREGLGIKVTALCDIDPVKLEGGGGGGNIDTSDSTLDFSGYARYMDVGDMLAAEKLDAVSIALPSHLHKEVSVRCLEHGLHVLCEKPMAMNAADCEEMIRAAEEAGKLLLIGQCLRFWPAYVYLKQAVEEGTYGRVTAGYFFRGGGTPTWGPWLMKKELSGGALLDMHVHDADAVNWLFGKPEAVSCLASNVIPGGGYDIVSTNYRYPDGKVVNTQVDWTLQGDFGFEMTYRVNFERGNLVFKDGTVRVHPENGAGFTAELSDEMGYYYELKSFVEAIAAGKTIPAAPPAETMATIELIEAEIESADNKGAWVTL